MLSVIIITKNEEPNIRRCLESVKFADEIIILDSGSTDRTIEIAQHYTSKLYSNDWRGYGIQKQRALDQASGDWVLNLDADESVSEDLQKEIKDAMINDKADAYRIPIRMNFYNQPLKYSGSPSRHVRLFKRSHGRYSDDIVHEKNILKDGSRIAKMKAPIVHHSFRDLSHALYKINKYSSYSAKIRIEKNKPGGFFRTLIGASWMFFRCYIIQRGFLDGKAGFLFAIFGAQGSFFRGMKQIYKDKSLFEESYLENPYLENHNEVDNIRTD